jgi:hypothetical protein
MRRTFLPLRRIAALSVAMTLFAAPIASAQSPEAAPANAAPANRALLRPAAFARLAQRPRTNPVPTPVVGTQPRLDLVHPGTTAMAREAKAALANAPQQTSWASRHKVATGIISGALAFFTYVVVCLYVCPE